MCAPSEKFLNMGGPLAIGLGVVLVSSLGKCHQAVIRSSKNMYIFILLVYIIVALYSILAFMDTF